MKVEYHKYYNMTVMKSAFGVTKDFLQRII
jgi:hypothetical protein